MQIELARSLLDQDHATAREHLDEADELSYRVQQELTALIDALRPAELQAKRYVSNILSKLHLEDRTQVAVFAWQQGLMERG